MPETTSEPARFTSFADLQREHLALMRSLRIAAEPVDDTQRRMQIDGMIERVKNTGKILDGAERQAAQNILDYWSADNVSLSDIGENWSLPKLLPLETAAAKSTPAAGVIQARSEARKRLQLAATARLWRDSGGDVGYLLSGDTALAEATRYQDDPDVAELVRASRVYLRNQRLVFRLVVMVVFLAFICIGLVATYIWQTTSYDTSVKQHESNRTTATLTKGIEQQQRQIKQLTDELTKAKVAVPTQLTETVTGPVVESAAAARLNFEPTVQRGYIWIGSEEEPNLVEAKTLATVKPSTVVAGGQYKVTKNLVLRSGLPTDEYVQAGSIGLVPDQTTVKVTSMPKQYHRQTTVQYWAAIDVDDPNQPNVYIEYANGSPELAQSLASRLKTVNFRVPGVESTDLAKGINEIRYFHASDKIAADRLAEAAAAAGRDLKLPGFPSPKVLNMTANAGPRNFPGVIELWIDLPVPKS